MKRKETPGLSTGFLAQGIVRNTRANNKELTSVAEMLSNQVSYMMLQVANSGERHQEQDQ